MTAVPPQQRIDAFDFDLPEECIALRPARPRDSARLMVIEPGQPNRHQRVRDLASLVRSGDLLVVNDTRVVPALLPATRGRAGSTAKVSLTLFSRVDARTWRAFAKPAKRLAVGDEVAIADGVLRAEVVEKAPDGSVRLSFSEASVELDRAIAGAGKMPLPSYIAARRAEDAADRLDYQTIFAREDGAIAAPTAGLHFTSDLLSDLGERGIELVSLTLHVGPGTFLPVKVEDISKHPMHAEWGAISEDAATMINRARQRGERIVAVGTTSLRLLESAADEGGEVRPFAGVTDIFITPGYRFRAVDLLMTNFHLPRSTLFMLVAAFSGHQRMHRAYREAIAAGYRFYSYGDACLLHPAAAA